MKMKKNGFTLVEILVSLTLLCVVLVPMLSMLVKLMTTYENANNDTNILINTSVLSNKLNKSIVDNYGISSVICNTNKDIDVNYYIKECTLNFSNNKTYTLSLKLSKEERAESTADIFSLINRSTIKYLDETNKIILMKTIHSIDTYKRSGGSISFRDSKFYHYTDISCDEVSLTNYKVFIITITATKPEHNIKIYSKIAE